MPILPRTLYVSDLDGTLLDDRAYLTNESIFQLQELINAGMQFTVASARSVISIQEKLEGLKLHLPVIEINGGFISNLDTGEHLVINELDTITTESIFKLCDKFDAQPVMSTFNGESDKLHFESYSNEGIELYVESRKQQGDPRLNQTDDLLNQLDEHVACLNVINRENKLRALYEALSEAFCNQIVMTLFENRYTPGWFWLTICDAKATKAEGVKTIQQNFAKETEEIVVFGDEANDIPLFEAAHRSYATANAIPALKDMATKVLGSNNENTVVDFLTQEAKQS